MSDPIVVPAHNKLALSLMAVDSDDWKYAPPDRRAEVIVRGNPRTLIAVILNSMAVNAAETFGEVWSIPLRGVTTVRGSGLFSAVILSHAPSPVTIRRRAWGDQKFCLYTNTYEHGLQMLARVSGGNADDGHNAFPLTSVDLGADDWEVIDVPAAESDDEDEFDDVVPSPESPLAFVPTDNRDAVLGALAGVRNGDQGRPMTLGFPAAVEFFNLYGNVSGSMTVKPTPDQLDAACNYAHNVKNRPYEEVSVARRAVCEHFGIEDTPATMHLRD